jgi:glycerol-3-phosphate dehydrogenase
VTSFDLIIIGGGINGCGIARDAAGRGLSVLVVEQGDLASATSSASTKLIHGGLRYLEHFEFRLVREALMERERLLEAAPHIIWPVRFVLPHESGVRPAWLVRLGLALYDHLAPRKKLAGSKTIRFANHAYGQPLKPHFKVGFAYSDCWVEDSRLVVLNAMDARERGADIRVQTRLTDAARDEDGWLVTLQDSVSGRISKVRGHVIVNAAGPWVADVLRGNLGVATAKSVRLVKGSHIVVPKLYDGDHAYILQNSDKRIVFAIPYEQSFTLIGTTDVPYQGGPGPIKISDEEVSYLCDSINHYWRAKIAPKDVVWSYSGVRPLFDDGSIDASVVTRDYVFDLDAPDGLAPALSVFGGKITTYRCLAEHVMADLSRFFPALKPAWTKGAVLPGGDIPDGDFAAFVDSLLAEKPFLAPEIARRLARAYGTKAREILADAQKYEDLGHDFGNGLTEAEIDYLVDSEFATTAEDIVWRRSKLGLHLPESAAAEIAHYLRQGEIDQERERRWTS